MKKEDDAARLARLKSIVAAMPEKPGSYQYYDAEGTIIYVGKAKRLKSRVSSYFHTEVDRFKTKVLVSKICDISYTVVKTEEDALLLENNLIKRYNPRYNVLLKDGKTYPSICVTREAFPRIFKTRTINRRWGDFFGPYSHIGAMNAVLDLIKELYHPRTCRLPLSEEGVRGGRYAVCLDYHIHNCGGCCCGKQSREDYLQGIAEARELLKGNTRDVLRAMRERMEALASELRFEEAEEIRKRYVLIEGWRAKSEVVSSTIDNIDVVSVESDEGLAYINFIHVAKGNIVQSFTFEYHRRLDETEAELLSLGIVEMRQRFGSTSREIVVPMEIDLPLEGVVLTVPQRGDKRTLLELSRMNCKQYRLDRLKRTEKLNPEQRSLRLLHEIQQALGMDRPPIRIECFDNSNISGTNAVAACVVFERMRPKKRDYRLYNIRSVVGPDDYASMQEVVRRRYTRLMTEQTTPLPDLIITDGGRGQMEVVRQVVEDELGLSIPIAGLAKDGRHRTSEVLFGFPPKVIGMKTTSELFHLLTQIQDEVHRFAITFHRNKRSKAALHSELDDIRGIGIKSKDALMARFKTVAAIAAAGEAELAEVVGAAKARIVREHFGGQSDQTE